MFVIACLLVLDLAWLPFSALRISASNLPVLLVLAGTFLLAGPMQRRYQLSPVVRNLAIDVYILLLFGCAGFIFSYLVIEHGWTIRDEWFVAIDQFLGFDWRAYTLFILQNSALRWASLVLYLLTPLLVGFTLFRSARHGEYERGSEFAAMVVVGGVLCVVISGLLPSAGGAGYFPADNDFYQGRMVVFDHSYKDTFFQLRDGAGMDVFLHRPVGLIAFPSYHACLAMLVIRYFWGHGLMGGTIVALNVGSVLSIPVQGGHHLSDALGGLLVGAIAFWAIRRNG